MNASLMSLNMVKQHQNLEYTVHGHGNNLSERAMAGSLDKISNTDSGAPQVPRMFWP